MVTQMIAPDGVDRLWPEERRTELDGLRRKVFLDRYALKDANGEPLELYPEQMWQRVAAGIASVEPDEARRTTWTERFYDLLSDFKFVPGGRILSGAGTAHEVTYYNCYVVGIGENPLNPDAPKQPQLDPEPARQAFFTALGEMTDIMARSGGVGMNLSSLPPAGTRIARAGRERNGVQRPTVALSIDHPDIETLLDQRDHPSLSRVDLGVIVPPAFDQALATGADWTLAWADRPAKAVSARVLWDRLHAADTRPIRVLRPGTPMVALEDSRESIVEGSRQAALALFAGQPIVVDFSQLRPKGAYIKTVNGTSSGPVAWMYLYDALARADDGTAEAEQGVIWFGEIASTITGKTIQQGGSRRGALMLMLDDDHPDVEAFVAAKRIDPETGRPVMLEHANLSVCVSDAFMAAVKADLPWDLRWKGQVVRTIRARSLWSQICASAWATAEPGVVFMQRAREQSPMWYRENIRCTNPCGEQPIPAGAVCNLGALNLACYVDDAGVLDAAGLGRDAAAATRFLDNVIDATPYFSELHVKMQREGTRRIGLGTMGLADALIKMRVGYGSAASLGAIDHIYGIIRDASYRASVALAEEKGACGFFEAGPYLESPFIHTLPDSIRAEIAAHGVRNGVLLTQAPTGTTSLLAGVSSGIEPVFDFAIRRTDRLGEHIIYHPLYQAWHDAHPGESEPDWFRSARDLTPEEHVQVQAQVQRYTDSSISKTANAPAHHTAEDVMKLYDMAYDLGCKGVTYYRDGSRDAVLTSASEPKKAAASVAAKEATVTTPVPTPAVVTSSAKVPVTMSTPAPAPIASFPATVKPRPHVVFGYTRQVKAPEGTVNITINSDDGGPLEVFISVGRAGSDIAALAEALGRLVSLALRLPSPIPTEERLQLMTTQLRGIGGSRSIGFGAERVLSLPDAVAQAFTKHLQEGLSNVPMPLPRNGNGAANGQSQPALQLTLPPVSLGNLCPQCGSSAAYVLEEGCKKCHNCGYSEC